VIDLEKDKEDVGDIVVDGREEDGMEVMDKDRDVVGVMDVFGKEVMEDVCEEDDFDGRRSFISF